MSGSRGNSGAKSFRPTGDITMTRNFKYPHLLPPDVPVWEWFLYQHGHLYRRFEYDVRVGPGQNPGPEIEPRLRQSAFDLSRRRIDAVGYRPGEIHVIEITKRAGLKAIGQVTAYPILYRLTFDAPAVVKSVLVCEELLVGAVEVLAELPVEVFVSGPLSEAIADASATNSTNND